MWYVGDNITAKLDAWNFSDIDHSSFENHIERSVSEYSQGHEFITFLSDYLLSSGSRVYDIGCSTGHPLGKISRYNHKKNGINFVGIEPLEKNSIN